VVNLQPVVRPEGGPQEAHPSDFDTFIFQKMDAGTLDDGDGNRAALSTMTGTKCLPVQLPVHGISIVATPDLVAQWFHTTRVCHRAVAGAQSTPPGSGCVHAGRV